VNLTSFLGQWRWSSKKRPPTTLCQHAHGDKGGSPCKRQFQILSDREHGASKEEGKSPVLKGRIHTPFTQLHSMTPTCTLYKTGSTHCLATRVNASLCACRSFACNQPNNMSSLKHTTSANSYGSLMLDDRATQSWRLFATACTHACLIPSPLSSITLSGLLLSSQPMVPH
jgi:hypothetical protein